MDFSVVVTLNNCSLKICILGGLPLKVSCHVPYLLQLGRETVSTAENPPAGVTALCLSFSRQSVRLRASTRKLKKNSREKLGKSPQATEIAARNASSAQNGKYGGPVGITTPPRKNSGGGLPDAGRPLNGRSRFQPYTSPLSSDSEDIDESVQQPSSPKVVNFKFKSKILQSKLKKFEQRSGSDSSLSEDNNPSTPTRPPPTPPRVSSAPKPLIQPKPPRLHSLGKTKSLKEADRPVVPVFRRPSVPQIIKEPPSPGTRPPQPPRPTGTQLRKVNDRSSKSPSPLPPSPHSKSPLSAVWEESGEESDSSSYGARLLSQARLKPTGKYRSQSSADSTRSLAPPPPPPSRPRGQTESEAANPFNQQMADTLIKYILASNDPGLKSAIVDIVKGSPDVLRALKEE